MKDITITTAVSQNYLRKFERAIKSWYQSPTIANSEIIVFSSLESYNDVRRIVKEQKSNYSYVEVIPWEHELYEHYSIKEEMLSSFIWGCNQYVTTKFSMKLDCDTTYKDDFQLPHKWHKNVITGHRWGYTKCKADPLYETTKVHWFDRLNVWFGDLSAHTGLRTPDDLTNTTHNYPHNIKEPRYSHRRIASFCCIQNQNFINDITALCGESIVSPNRMPIPSHDTFLFYVAERLGYNIGYVNFKKYFNV